MRCSLWCLGRLCSGWRRFRARSLDRMAICARVPLGRGDVPDVGGGCVSILDECDLLVRLVYDPLRGSWTRLSLVFW